MQRTHFVLLSQFGMKLIYTGRNWRLSREALWTQSKVHKRIRGEEMERAETGLSNSGWQQKVKIKIPLNRNKIKTPWNNAVKIKEAFCDHEENDKERKRKKKVFSSFLCCASEPAGLASRQAPPSPHWNKGGSESGHPMTSLRPTLIHIFIYLVHCLEHFPLGIPC